MPAEEVAATGVYVDEAGRVVTTPPERGTQLVAPGGAIPADIAAMIPVPEPAKKPVKKPVKKPDDLR